MFTIYQLTCKVYSKEKIQLKDSLIEVREFIDLTFNNDVKYEEFHNSNLYDGGKQYTFNKLYPYDTVKKVYEEDGIYEFEMRTSNFELAEFFLNKLANVESKTLKGLKVTIKKVNTNKIIEKIYTHTPVIITTEDKDYWRNNNEIEFMEDRIVSNTSKKSNRGDNSNIKNIKFFNDLEITSKGPVRCVVKRKEKEIVRLGDKVILYINSDKESQELAWRVIAEGLLEKNARGYGYVGFKCY